MTAQIIPFRLRPRLNPAQSALVDEWVATYFHGDRDRKDEWQDVCNVLRDAAKLGVVRCLDLIEETERRAATR